MVLELLGLKVARLGLYDVRSQLKHVFWNFFIRYALEIFILFAHLVGIAQRKPEKPFTARFKCDDVLARRENNPPERYHSLLADRLANDRECLFADLAVGNEIVGTIEIQLVDFFLRHELVDLDCALALDGDRLKLFGLNLDILAFANLVALDDVGRIDLVAGLGIHLSVFDAIAGLLIDLIEANLLSFGARRKQRYGARNQREL